MTGKLLLPLEEVTNNRRRHESYSRGGAISGGCTINASFDTDLTPVSRFAKDQQRFNHFSNSTKPQQFRKTAAQPLCRTDANSAAGGFNHYQMRDYSKPQRETQTIDVHTGKQ